MTVEEMRKKKAELGLTNEMIAEYSDVPLSTVSKVFAGITAHPRYETLQALEKMFYWIAGGKEYYVPPQGFGTAGGSGKDGSSGNNESGSSGNDGGSGAGLVREPQFVYRTGSGERKDPAGEKRQGEYTLDDYYGWPEEQRVELIDGVIYDMGAPTPLHQTLALKIWGCLDRYIDENGGSCIPYAAPADVHLKMSDDKTMVQPDVFVVCDRSKVKEKRIEGAPDLVIEVISPSSIKKDAFTKLAKYAESGVREYWLVYPEKKKVVVYTLENNDVPRVYGFEDEVPVGIFEGKCVIDFAKIYEKVAFQYGEDV